MAVVTTKLFNQDVIETVYKTRRMANGYTVTVASIGIPANEFIIFGASVCSPEDWFDVERAAPRALGRARAVATWFLGNVEKWQERVTLLGPAQDCIYPLQFDEEFHVHADDVKIVRRVVEFLYKAAARNAESVCLDKHLCAIAKRFPNFALYFEDAPAPKL